MINWFHKFLHPHCPECKEDYLDEQVCDSCNTLRMENQALRKHNDQLIQSLLEVVRPKEIIQQEIKVEDFKPVNHNLPWRARKHILETEDKRAAEVLREKRKEMEAVPVTTSVEKLEEELGVKVNG